jgi:hypothetical protein
MREKRTLGASIGSAIIAWLMINTTEYLVARFITGTIQGGSAEFPLISADWRYHMMLFVQSLITLLAFWTANRKYIA